MNAIQGNARWEISKNQQGEWTVLYRNLRDDVVSDCGTNRADTPDVLILKWIFENADPGDTVTMFGEWVATVAPATNDANVNQWLTQAPAQA
jgi:hypothetical protein